MESERISELRKDLIVLRNSCLGPERFDPYGAVILSRAIRWLSFEEKGEDYVPSQD